MHLFSFQTSSLIPRLTLLFLIAFSLPLKANPPAHTPLPALPAGYLPTLPAGPLPTFEIPALPAITTTLDLTQENEDLWDRIRQGFSMPDISGKEVLIHHQWYLDHPGALTNLIERSRRYLFYIVEALQKRGMPMELAFLPMVESAYDPRALSSAKAAGLWQFIPSTGKNFNLDQNWWHDERRDITASTEAALDYLEMLYAMFGDWHLALAAYNWGEGAVGRAIAKNQARNLPTDYQSLTMPSETRHYVPKLQALKNILGNPALFKRLNAKPLPNRPFFREVQMPAPIDLKLAAKLAGMSLKDFVALNPAHNRPLIRSASLLVPADKAELFEENLQKHEKPLSTWETYTLKAGEQIEKLARRLGLPLSELKRVNSLPERGKPPAGTELLVPGKDNTETAQSIRELPTLALPPSAPKKARPKRSRHQMESAAKPDDKKHGDRSRSSGTKGTPSGKGAVHRSNAGGNGTPKAGKPAKASHP